MEQENKEKQSPVLKGFKIAGTVIFYLIILFIFLVSIANIRAGKSEDKMPNIFGRGYLTVQSNSMEGSQSDSFKTNDMVVVNALTSEKSRVKAASKLEVGDIVTFYDQKLSSTKKLNTHRVVLITYDSNSNVQSIYTMGDKYAEGTMKTLYWGGEYSQTMFEEKYGDFATNNQSAQMIETLISGGNLQELSVSDLRGTYIKTIAGGGKVEGFIKQYGNVVVLLPLFLFLALEIFFFSRNVIAYKKAKYAETHADEIEAEKNAEKERLKAELRAQLLEEMKNEELKKDEESNSSEDKKDEE